MNQSGNEPDRVRERPDPSRDIMGAFREGTGIDRALRRGVREALERHRKLGHSVVVAEEGQVRIVPADQIHIEE